MVASVLQSMVEAGHVGEIFSLLECGDLKISDLQFPEAATLRNQNGETLLMVSARTGQLDILNHLLPDSDLDDTDNDGWTALLDAAHEGHGEIVSALLHAGAAVDVPDLMGWSPLMWAVYKNHPACVEILLSHKAHVNLIEEEDGLTSLIIASGRGFTEIVKQLLTYGAEVNACDKFGSTALIWAARKGFLAVVELLLIAGAEIDAIGMYSSTALILAVRGNYVNVVELLLSREPNVNVTEQNGMSALAIAAREGYSEIVEMLVFAGAYVNVVDRFGNSVLAGAVRSGNVNIVRMLLDKHADENRTPLHLAVDKSYTDMVLAILEKKPNLELKNKDGDTALLRAVKNRNVALCQLLVSAGAKISTTDNAGDNPLHLALRGKSKRLTQSLLANPSDSRLLYRPNKSGHTPYFIDQCHPKPILPLIFGPVETESHVDAMLGYNIYSNVLADIACEPSLTMPLTVGLYAKWGSGKSILLAKLKDSMATFSRSWLDGVQLLWSWSLVFSLAACVFLATLVGISVVAIFKDYKWIVFVSSVGGVIFVSLFTVYAFIYYGSEVKGWNTSVSIGRSIARLHAQLRIFMNVMLLEAPARNEKDLLMHPVNFLFADYHRLSSVGGEQAIAKIISTLFEAAENCFGCLTIRVACGLKIPLPHGNRSRFRSACGIPVIILMVAHVLLLVISLLCLCQYFLTSKNGIYQNAQSYLYCAISFFALCCLLSVYPVYLFLYYGFINTPKRRIEFTVHKLNTLRFEGFMQKLQHEVNLITALINFLDAFTSSQTRLVILVDGLDNCEQERMIQTLDALELLFTARQNRPFIVTIAVDPHIIISAINNSLHSALAGTELTGHDYLKANNIVNMPFYLHNSALRQLQTNLREKRESLAAWKARFQRQDTFHGSYMSLKEEIKPVRKGTQLVGTKGISQSLMTDDYFSNMNPRAMRRIVNALTLTGRLMRAFEIEFSWVMLGYWVSLIEQWPSRMCWLIDQASDIGQENLSLAQVYYQLKNKIPKKDPLIDLDRNSENFEYFLEQACVQGPDQLTIGHVRRFIPCTSNLDPYLRKLIRERRMEVEGPTISGEDTVTLERRNIKDPLRYLFKDDLVWETVRQPLIEMKIDEIIRLVRLLDISPDRMDQVIQKFRYLNLNGLVLATCDLSDVQHALKLSLGDWTLIKLLIQGLRKWVPVKIDRNLQSSTIMQQSTSLASIQEAKDMSLEGIGNDHKWLMDSLSGMDKAETEGDLENTSRAPSTRFEDDGAATDGDSTESMCGSEENLLDSVSPARIQSPVAQEEIMRKMKADSIHSGKSGRSTGSRSRSSGITAISSAENNQLTVRKRTSTEDDVKLLAMDIFDKNAM
uniref:ANK_REP_REGION domain-containing protein n=1 Tax=Syphacia muris TaxID=451379 RepID=A0A0N5AP23_9BILA